VGMRNYFCPDDTQVRQRVSGEVVVEKAVVRLSLFEPLNNQDEVAARGRCMCKFSAHDEGHHVNVPVVRPDTPPTPRTPVPHDEHRATPVTPGAPIEAVLISFGGSPEPSEGRSLPATPRGGSAGEFAQIQVLSHH